MISDIIIIRDAFAQIKVLTRQRIKVNSTDFILQYIWRKER